MAGGLVLAAVLDQVLVRALDLDEPPGVALVVVWVDCSDTKKPVSILVTCVDPKMTRECRRKGR